MNGSLPASLTSTRHILLSGVTGAGDGDGGKTAVLNYLADVHASDGRPAIVWNPKGHEWVKGHTVRGIDALGSAWGGGHRHIDYRPVAVDADGEAAEFDRFAGFVRRVHDRVGGEWFVGADEAADYADTDGLEWLFRRAGNLDGGGIKTVAVAQRPWDLPDTIRTNAAVGIVGPVSGEGRRYLDVLGMSDVADAVQEWHTEPFRWSILDGSELYHFPPVPARYAGEA